ncbi:alpha/beta hydrolase [Nocardia sp. NPDC050710]|uniref:alpha/beta fold hydrolase n=1 Tax=Nocardia sp. NPDC050710 TaxID=3157220 RepID=UPI0033CAD04B
MTEEMATEVGPSRIEVAYERLGDPARPPVLLIMGAAGQLINWPDGLCAELVDRGLHLIRFDSRDTGRSTRFSDACPPDIRAAMAGDLSSASYTLSDMAADSVGLLDALGIGSAHVVGASMGGMIAQTIAIEYPGRIRSLTSIMSSTGDPDVGRSDPDAFGAAGPPPADRPGYIDWSVRSMRATGSPGFTFDEAAAAELAGRVYDRGFDLDGMMRQAVAVLASGDRTARLRSLRLPTLVLHGTADRLFDISGGQATAEAVPDAKLMTFDGMGHSLPRALWATFADNIAEVVYRAEAGVGGAPVPNDSRP